MLESLFFGANPFLTLAAQIGDDSATDFGWPLAIFLVGSALAIFGAASVLAWQIFATWRARMAVARDQAYRELAVSVSAAMAEQAEELARTRTELTRLTAQTEEIAKLLRDV